MTTDPNATATAILSRAAVLRKDDEEDLRRAIVEALHNTRVQALEAACRALCEWCAHATPIEYQAPHWRHPGRSPHGPRDWGWYQCPATAIHNLIHNQPLPVLKCERCGRTAQGPLRGSDCLAPSTGEAVCRGVLWLTDEVDEDDV